MAVIKGDVLLNLIASDINKTPKATKYYINGIVQRIFKEILRGNQVNIERFGTFKPTFSGGYELDAFGKKQWVEPRVGIEFNLTTAGLQLLNNKVLDSETKKRMREGNLYEYERELLGIRNKKKKRDLEEIFFEILGNLEENESDFDVK